ncbi:hypothetical protein Mterra_00226 [Calidithermus terrae]|uniref:Uncharacterized protein n=2 Tax=Calidithermus TaxID=2747271 RepID=A0A399EL36_9DEIN|nr:hypothetical protein Mrose_02786 [Calidithermus roseus]RIH90732.1 hypothetical protein Mterra_00226 [Calidithermus terrae]
MQAKQIRWIVKPVQASRPGTRPNTNVNCLC